MLSFATPWGHIDVVDITAELELSSLHPGEQALCAPWGDKRKATFIAGRRALRAALRTAGIAEDVVVAAIGRDARGAPVLPAGVCGSVTHKDHVAAALVEVGGNGFVGIDLEVEDGFDAVRIDRLATQVLTPREQQTLPTELDERRRAVLARFSLKEALYKALDRHVGRYVGFLDVEVDVDDNAAVFNVGSVGAFVGTGAVVEIGRPGIILTVARVVAGSSP